MIELILFFGLWFVATLGTIWLVIYVGDEKIKNWGYLHSAISGMLSGMFWMSLFRIVINFE